MEAKQQAEIIRRLRCAVGHLNAVIEMAESGQPCEQVLYQLNAVRSALSAVGVKVIHCQAQSSQSVILNSSSMSKRTAELKRLQTLYSILTQHFNRFHEVTHD